MTRSLARSSRHCLLLLGLSLPGSAQGVLEALRAEGSGGEELGWAVSGAGDVDGDGYDDVLAGGLLYSNGEFFEGRAVLYRGSAAGPLQSPAWSVEGNQEFALLGIELAGAGDVNGDGFDDVIVAAPNFSNGQPCEGAAFVYLGSAAGLSSTATVLEFDQPFTYFASAVAGAGDVNADGFDDVLVSSPYHGNGEVEEGVVLVYLGSASGLTAPTVIERDEANALFGYTLASAGDVNGDTFDDVVLTALLHTNGEFREGGAFLYLGSPIGLITSPDWQFETDQVEARIRDARGAGDVNGDGFADVLVSSVQYDNPEIDEGRVFLFLGGAGGLASSPAWTAEGDQASASFGVSVAGAGDVNGDGFGDVLIGAHQFDQGEVDEGQAHLYLGSESGLATSPAWTGEGDEGLAAFGISVRGAGDVNRDGQADFLVGAPGLAANDGAAVVHLGQLPLVLAHRKIGEGAGGFAGTLDATDGFAYRTVSLGDLDGAGPSAVAVAVSQREDDTDGAEAGALWILFLDAGGSVLSERKITSGTHGFVGPVAADSQFSLGLAAIGDLDDDGVVDLAVGAPQDDGNGLDRGALWILLLNSDGTVKAEQKVGELDGGFTGTLDDFDDFGWSIEALGDLDGDGIEDVAVGAIGDDDQAAEAGAVWILFLDTDGTVQSHQKVTPAGTLATSDLFGTGLAWLGDLDGPGGNAGALAVGASSDDTAGADAGAVWILFLSSAGLVQSERKIVPGRSGFGGELDAGDAFGSGLASLGDLGRGGLGVRDLAVGADDDDGGASAGAVWVLALDSTGFVVGEQKISATEDRFTGQIDDEDALGTGLSSLGDLDGDGRGEIVMGASYAGPGAPQGDGALWVVSLNDNTLDLLAGTTWTGATDSDWTDPSNWSAGTPDPTVSAIIPDAATTPNDPVITVGGQTANTLWIQSGGTLDLSAGMDSLGVFGGATVQGPITGTGELVFEELGTLAGNSTIASTSVRAESDLAVQGGPLVLAGTLTGNASVFIETSADLSVQTDVVTQGDLSVDGALSVSGSLDVGGGIVDSTASGGGGGSIFVGGSGDCVTAGEICFHGEVVTACSLNIENPSTGDLNLDIDDGWPGGISIDVGGTITLLTSAFSVAGDLVVQNGTLAVGVDGTLDVDGANGIVVEAPAVLDVTGFQTLVLAPAPVTVRGKLNIGPGGELLLETNTLAIESGGTLCLDGDALDFANISGSGSSRYVLDLRAGSTLAAKNFAFRQMDAAGIRIGANVAIAPAPLDLRNGLFDLPADGGRLLELVRAAPSGFRYLRFENTLGASGAVNVRVPAFSDAIELVNWSGAFAGPGFEDDPGNLLTWGPPEASDVSGFTADWKPDHVRLSWTTSAEVDTESWIVTRSPEPPGLFVSAGGLPAAGPGSYGFSDFQVSAATAYRYRLYERLTHGALVLQDELMLEASELPVLLPNWGQPAPPPPPPLPFVVGPGGVFPDVGTALAALSGTHRGERVGLELAAGVHAAFELAGSSLGFDLALTARPGAVIDASLAPLRITGLPPERSLELAGLVIEAGGAFHPALGVEDCAGVVLLDALAVHGSANGSGVELRGARCVALQGCELAGAPALSLGRGSRASLRGAEPAAEVEPGSLLRACLDGARLVPGERRLALEDGGEGLAWLLAAPRLGFAAPTDARVTGDLLLERTGLRVLAGPRALLEGRTSWRLPEGAPYRYFQALVVDRAGARFALSPVRAGER